MIYPTVITKFPVKIGLLHRQYFLLTIFLITDSSAVKFGSPLQPFWTELDTLLTLILFSNS